MSDLGDQVERPSVPVLTFLGGAGTVTGSRFLLDTSRARVLFDAGLFQGVKELRLRNRQPFHVDPATIDAVAVSHAHVDHIGYVPVLTRDGFTGSIHCTRETSELAAIVLPDSGHLQEEEAAYANRKGFSRHHPALPLYTEQDARDSLRQLRAHPYDQEVEVAPGVHVTLRPAGHILGSATVTVRLADHGDRCVAFSGDLGRRHHPILEPPAPLRDVDVVVMESTYGDRRHDDTDASEQFADAILRTIRRGGTVLIPAFAVDRTEVVLHQLKELVGSGRIPEVPIFVDSPMALSALAVYRSALGRAGSGTHPYLRDVADALGGAHVREVRDVEGSKALADVTTPSIVISASGMATGGRVVHHLARLLPNHRNSVLLVGFQAVGTRGRMLADGADELKMLGRYVRVRAEVVDLNSFSVHADQTELLEWLAAADPQPETVHLVHGEPDAAATLRDLIERDDKGPQAIVARLGERVRLD